MRSVLRERRRIRPLLSLGGEQASSSRARGRSDRLELGYRRRAAVNSQPNELFDQRVGRLTLGTSATTKPFGSASRGRDRVAGTAAMPAWLDHCERSGIVLAYRPRR